jgi:hypothetical protein
MKYGILLGFIGLLLALVWLHAPTGVIIFGSTGSFPQTIKQLSGTFSTFDANSMLRDSVW